MSDGAPDHIAPMLSRVTVPDPRGLVLVLHGGAARGRRPVDHRSLTWQRSRRLVSEIAGPLATEGVGVVLLRYRYRGWDAGVEPSPAPVPDARWALDRVREQHPGRPVVLLGHSMGGRTAVAVADDPAVAGVVALAPWLPPGEPVHTLRGKRLEAAHGRTDRITSARATRAYVERAVAEGVDAHFTDMGRVGHYLLRKAHRWNEFAATRSLALLAPP